VDRARGTEESWRLTLQHSPIGMGLVDLDGRILVVNRALCDMLGYEPEQLRAKRFQDITHPDDLEESLSLQKQALAGEIDSLRLRKRYLHSDGSVLWVDLSSAPVRNDDGTILHFVTQFLDITEQHASEARLAAANRALECERRTLETIFDTVDVGLLLLGPDGSYQRMNRRHAETMSLQYPEGHHGRAGQPGEVYGPDGRTPLPPEQLPSYRAMHGEEFDDVRVWAGADPATRKAFSVSARKVHDNEGEVTGSALAYKEITDFLRALRAKEEFLGRVSHELRTPLTVVLAHLELLVDDNDLPPRIRPQLEAIERNARRLQSLVIDLLQVAQAVDGGLELQLTDVDLVPLLSETIESWRPRVDASGLTLVCETPPRLVANVDGQRLRQVVDHLVSNAVTYTGTGGTITLKLEGDGRHVRLWVSDTGIGMDEAERDEVFSWFVRGDEAARQLIPGTGLGLTIVRSIVIAHGGEVTVDTTPGVGSTFHVTLPQGV
jgi:two-component system, OmpR family, phosphate regulon sensor histidine kinase PhoR